MDAKLDNLIEKLKEEGVEGARKAADEILSEARQQSEERMQEARQRAEQREKEAEARAEQFLSSAERAVKQAGRDAELLLRERIDALFTRVFRRQVADAMTPDLLKEVIGRIVDNWAKGEAIEVEISGAQAEQLEATLLGGVAEEAEEGITLKPSAALSGGFHIKKKGEDVYYDFSDEAVSELLRSFLNDRINAILAGEDG